MAALTDFDKENITSLFFHNYNASYISSFLELPAHQVNEFIKERQLRKRRETRNLSMLIRLCDENYTKKEVAEKMNISEERVYSLAKKNGLHPNFRKKQSLSKENKIIISYMDAPCSIKTMSQRVGISESLVRRVYKEKGFKSIFSHYNTKKAVLSERQYKDLLSDLKTTEDSLGKLSEKYKISRQRIFQIQKKENIIRPKSFQVRAD